MVNTTQQVGGSLGTALLNTFAASATASYFAAHGGAHAASRFITQSALVSGYHRAFEFGAGALVLAAIATMLLVKAKGSEVAEIATSGGAG
jgi:hypothetical protein